MNGILLQVAPLHHSFVFLQLNQLFLVIDGLGDAEGPTSYISYQNSLRLG